MGRVGLVRTLKGVILFLAAMGAVFYGFFEKSLLFVPFLRSGYSSS